PAAWARFNKQLGDARADALTYQRRILSTLLMPAVQKVGEATLRDQALLATAEAALAAERFRLANKRWPKTLAELTPALLPVEPLDPYTGKPLLYVRRNGEVVIYSVGKDLADGGGENLRFPNRPNWDVGVRLYDPEKRRLPF